MAEPFPLGTSKTHLIDVRCIPTSWTYAIENWHSFKNANYLNIARSTESLKLAIKMSWMIILARSKCMSLEKLSSEKDQLYNYINNHVKNVRWFLELSHYDNFTSNVCCTLVLFCVLRSRERNFHIAGAERIMPRRIPVLLVRLLQDQVRVVHQYFIPSTTVVTGM